MREHGDLFHAVKNFYGDRRVRPGDVTRARFLEKRLEEALSERAHGSGVKS